MDANDTPPPVGREGERAGRTRLHAGHVVADDAGLAPGVDGRSAGRQPAAGRHRNDCMRRTDRLTGAAPGAGGEEGHFGKRPRRAGIALLDQPVFGLFQEAFAPLADALAKEIPAIAADAEEVAKVDSHVGKLTPKGYYSAMPPTRVLGFATRLTLLVMFLAGGRAECAATLTADLAGSEPRTSDCHHANAGNPGPSPAAPTQQQQSHSATHHCAALHSCALDPPRSMLPPFATAIVGSKAQAFPARNPLRTTLTQLPEVPLPEPSRHSALAPKALSKINSTSPIQVRAVLKSAAPAVPTLGDA